MLGKCVLYGAQLSRSPDVSPASVHHPSKRLSSPRAWGWGGLRKGSAHKLGTVKQVEVRPMNMCFHGIPPPLCKKAVPFRVGRTWGESWLSLLSCVTLSDWLYFSEPPLPHL